MLGRINFFVFLKLFTKEGNLSIFCLRLLDIQRPGAIDWSLGAMASTGAYRGDVWP